jgi:hypothetical protein
VGIGRALSQDVLAGAVFVTLGLIFGGISLTYELGTPLRMGPGFFPLILGVVLAGLGSIVIAKGMLAEEAKPIGEIRWPAVAQILAALLFFGLTVRGLGVVGALLGTSFLAALAGHRTGPLAALLIAIGLTITSILIFIVALQLRLPLVGPWIPL